MRSDDRHPGLHQLFSNPLVSTGLPEKFLSYFTTNNRSRYAMLVILRCWPGALEVSTIYFLICYSVHKLVLLIYLILLLINNYPLEFQIFEINSEKKILCEIVSGRLISFIKFYPDERYLGEHWHLPTS